MSPSFAFQEGKCCFWVKSGNTSHPVIKELLMLAGEGIHATNVSKFRTFQGKKKVKSQWKFQVLSANANGYEIQYVVQTQQGLSWGIWAMNQTITNLIKNREETIFFPLVSSHSFWKQKPYSETLCKCRMRLACVDFLINPIKMKLVGWNPQNENLNFISQQPLNKSPTGLLSPHSDEIPRDIFLLCGFYSDFAHTQNFPKMIFLTMECPEKFSTRTSIVVGLLFGLFA